MQTGLYEGFRSDPGDFLSAIPTKSRRVYACEVCGRVLRDSSDLRRHSRTHSGDKPFSCTFCGKRFGRRDHLNNHAVIHYNRPKNK